MDPKTAPPTAAPMIDPGDGAVTIKVGIVDEFDEGDRLALIVVMFGLELSPGVVGDEFAIV